MANIYDRMTTSEREALRLSMFTGGISTYGGSEFEAQMGRICQELREQCFRYGLTWREEKGKIIITPNDPPESKNQAG